MSIRLYRSIFKILFFDASMWKFAVGIILGLAFSISVILGTIGIMDGFDQSLRGALKSSSGDFSIHSQDGFFSFEEDLSWGFEKLKIKEYHNFIQTQGFVVHNSESVGGIINSLKTSGDFTIHGEKIVPAKDQIFIGENLAKRMQVKVGDTVALTLPQGNQQLGGLPLIIRTTVKKVIHHGVYQKDLRFIYMNPAQLSEILNIKNTVNLVYFSLPKLVEEKISEKGESEDSVYRDFKKSLESFLNSSFIIRPYWGEYEVIMQGARAEKFMIGLVLQIVVVISVFNVIAFIVFLQERKSQEIFLLKALGLSQKRVTSIWLMLIILIWPLASLTSIFFLKIFNWMLQNLKFFEVPAQIYHLPRLELVIDTQSYIICFVGALLQLLVVSIPFLYRLKKRSVLEGLRKEFQ
jgi:ABC-type lipoprotein release transport system permease subunit